LARFGDSNQTNCVRSVNSVPPSIAALQTISSPAFRCAVVGGAEFRVFEVL
jgi:hypothetical protein